MALDFRNTEFDAILIDLMITEKLEKNPLPFLDFPQKIQMKGIKHEDVRQYFAAEMSGRHMYTVLVFGLRCLDKLLAAFVNGGQQKVIESNHYAEMLIRLSAYHSVLSLFVREETQKFIPDAEKRRSIESLFTQGDIEKIEQCINQLIQNLPKEAAECYLWIEKDAAYQKTQGILMKWSDISSAGKDGTPISILKKNIRRILRYLDILCYGGCRLDVDSARGLVFERE
jgi:hypothetical protein